MYKYVLLFFIYAFIGWLIEIILTLFSEKRLVNRGFLIGPYIPIYGVGMVFLTIVLFKLHNSIMMFLVTFLICSILEYSTSWVLEKLFKLKWWDYQQFKFNLNGRICLETMIPFSIGGVLAVKYINPLLFSIINKMPIKLIVIFEIVLVIIFLIDVIVSNLLIKNMQISGSNKDNTEEIKKNMKNSIKTKTKKYIKKNH